ncbi:MAG: polysaccharide biosynthesis protein [Candidatus Moranbacteria bacterium]|nr:polysaccharide biosynthesis protein [Candidatus Moranbacteria bacterium]
MGEISVTLGIMYTSKNILIIGAGKAGQLLRKDILANYPNYQVIGFVDDKIKETKGLLKGKIADIEKLVRLYAVDEMVIAIPSADGPLVRRILLQNRDNTIPIRIVPRDQRVIGKSEVLYAEVKKLDSEDFLGRPFVRKNVDRLKKFYQDKVVFVTGGAGSIGSEIVRQLIDLDVKKVVVYDNSEYLVFLLEQSLKERGVRDRCELIVGNILYNNKLKNVLAKIKPDIVFHAAAYKHVHLMHDNVDQAIYNNVIGTKRLIDAALESGVKIFTFISTDKVVNPSSVMGATKKLCEFYIQSLKSKKTHFNIVRFGNVINSNGSALPLFERQIELHRYVTVTHEKMERFFMSIREAAQLVIESTATGKSNAIHVLDMGELIRIYDVALSLIRSKDLRPNVDVEVRVTGLRKGEKMIEELYTEDEKRELKKTKDSRMFLLKNTDICKENIVEVFENLRQMAISGDDEKSFKYLKKLFPSLKN